MRERGVERKSLCFSSCQSDFTLCVLFRILRYILSISLSLFHSLSLSQFILYCSVKFSCFFPNVSVLFRLFYVCFINSLHFFLSFKCVILVYLNFFLLYTETQTLSQNPASFRWIFLILIDKQTKRHLIHKLCLMFPIHCKAVDLAQLMIKHFSQ